MRTTEAEAESTITKGLKDTEELRSDLIKCLDQLARHQVLRTENRSYTLQAEQTLKKWQLSMLKRLNEKRLSGRTPRRSKALTRGSRQCATC